MLQLSKRCGFVCTALTEYKIVVANAIASRLLHRSGKSVYQSVSFNIPLFAREAAVEIFGETGLVENTTTAVHWKLKTMASCATVMEALIPGASTSNCVGMSRALLSESETTALVIAILMPTLEVKWETEAKGGSCLRVNFLYVLMDADGEVHAPKDENRVQVDIGHIEQDLRQRVLLDARGMIDRGIPLSSGWYRQLGLMQEAAAVAACEGAGVRPVAAKAVAKAAAKAAVGKEGVTKKTHWNVSRIIEERSSTGKAKVHFLVEWVGYHPTWERYRINGVVGDPIQTWEVLKAIRYTEAFYHWRGLPLPAQMLAASQQCPRRPRRR